MASDNLPVIVGLPGILETHEELSDLLLPFGKIGYRVVIPNFPGKYLGKGYNVGWFRGYYFFSIF